jgi:alpha/beta superfamily hydrolase
MQNKFSIKGNAGIIEGIIHFPVENSAPLIKREPHAIAVVAHPLPTMGGTMDNKIVTTLAKTFVELGMVAIRFNFRGVGGSGGKFDDGLGEVDDVLAVVQHARQLFGNLPLIFAGFSFGAFVQACAAQQVHPQQMVLVAPAVGRFAMPTVPSNTLVIHGDQDDVVLLADMLDWARPQQLPIVVLPGADHYFHGRLGQIKQLVLREFKGHYS